MSKKLTQEEFIFRSIACHGYAYDYSEALYTTAKSPVKIFCKKHQEFFTQGAFDHMNGQGCPKCGLLKRNQTQSKSQEQFIADCVAVHGDTYDYSLVNYISGNYKVLIRCKKHDHIFEQSPKHHQRGQGCPICRYEKIGAKGRSNTDTFISKAIEVHGEVYDYSKVAYTKSNQPVKIICHIHGEFSATPNNHLKGKGCPDCASHGYRPNLTGSLYVLQCGDITKIGITNTCPTVRALRVSKSFGAEFSVVDSWQFENGKIPDEIETCLLKELRKQYDRPSNRFEGSSECFLQVDRNLLLSRIHQEIALRQ